MAKDEADEIVRQSETAGAVECSFTPCGEPVVAEVIWGGGREYPQLRTQKACVCLKHCDELWTSVKPYVDLGRMFYIINEPRQSSER